MIAYRKLLAQFDQAGDADRASESWEAAHRSVRQQIPIELRVEEERLDRLIRQLDGMLPNGPASQPAVADARKNDSPLTSPATTSEQQMTEVRVSVASGSRAARHGQQVEPVTPRQPLVFRPATPPGPTGCGIVHTYRWPPGTLKGQPGKEADGQPDHTANAAYPIALPAFPTNVPARLDLPRGPAIVLLPLRSLLWAEPIAPPSSERRVAYAACADAPLVVAPCPAPRRRSDAERSNADTAPTPQASEEAIGTPHVTPAPARSTAPEADTRPNAPAGLHPVLANALAAVGLLLGIVSLLILFNELLYWL